MKNQGIATASPDEFKFEVCNPTLISVYSWMNLMRDLLTEERRNDDYGVTKNFAYKKSKTWYWKKKQ